MIVKKHHSISLIRRIFQRRKLISIVIFSSLVSLFLFSAGYLYHRSGHFLKTPFSMLTSPLITAKNYVNGQLFSKPEKILIDIEFVHYKKIVQKRQESLKKGYLISTPDDWVPATIRHNGKVYKVDLRLKGDLEDHWKYDNNWSFKIKVKGKEKLFGMKRFAIQHPRTRHYMDEWILYKLFEQAGLIRLRYDFIDVTINGKHQPIYAIEENFDKMLVEENSLREGPIFRFDTGIYRHNTQQGLEPVFIGSAISPYQSSKILGNKLLENQFSTARSLVESFRQGKLKTSQVFDVKKMAYFFAIIDLTGWRHASLLDNLKFYYNPITSLIEPVGYNNELLVLLTAEQTLQPLEGANKILDLNGKESFDNADWYVSMFKDIEFYKQYILALEEISSTTFLDDFFKNIEEEYEEKLSILHNSYPWYNFEGKTVLYSNQEFIRTILNPSKSIHAYFIDLNEDDNSVSINLCNIYAFPAEILGLSIGKSKFIEIGQKTIVQARVRSEPLSYVPVKFDLPDNFSEANSLISEMKIVYHVLGTNKVRTEVIDPWSNLLENFIATDFMRQPPNIDKFKFLEIDESTHRIFIKPGDWDLNEYLIVPGGYTFVCNEGTKLNLKNSSRILSYSPVRFYGSEEEPILIHSSDSTGQGLIVINAEGESILEHVRFENLGNPSQHNWNLTGAITFYESPVVFSNCYFARNRSEDALNIVRSRFEIMNSIFTDISSDAIDSDYSKGNITNSFFNKCVNDALDISGSILEVSDIVINEVGDKGISIGEGSVLTATDIKVKNAAIGVASKDLSKAKINNIEITNCNVGLTAFQKKPEFGPGSLYVDDLVIDETITPYLIEKESLLMIDGSKVVSDREKVSQILYGTE